MDPQPSFEQLLGNWDGETAVVRRDPESGAWIFVCLHSTRLGPAGGGTRMKVYATPAEGRLSPSDVESGDSWSIREPFGQSSVRARRLRP
jgi:hypothetical protein